MLPESLIRRRRLPSWVVPFNPDANDLLTREQVDLPTRLGTSRVGTRTTDTGAAASNRILNMQVLASRPGMLGDKITEDDPRWDSAQHGNRLRGVRPRFQFREQDQDEPRALGESLVFNKRLGSFDSYDIDRREGETPEEAMRRIDLGNTVVHRQPPPSAEWLSSDSLRDGSLNPYATDNASEEVISRRPERPSGQMLPNFNSGNIAPTTNLPPLELADLSRIGGKPRCEFAVNDDDYRGGLEAYQPKGGINKKRALLTAGLGFITGGIPWAIGSTANYLLDPNARERQWRDRELTQLDEREERQSQRRRMGLQDRLLEARVLDAETPDEPKRQFDWLAVDTDEDGIPDKEEYAEIKPGIRRRLALPKPLPGFDLSPGQARYDASGKLIVERPAIEKPDTSEFTNENLQRNIQEAIIERDRIWASLKDVPPTITKPAQYAGEPPTIEPNPAYTDLMRRGRELDDHIRTYRGQLKPGRTRSTQSSGGGKKWSASRWAAANPNGNLEAAKQKARAQGLQVVE